MAPFMQELIFKFSIPAHQSPAVPSQGGTITVSRLILPQPNSLPSGPTSNTPSQPTPTPSRSRPPQPQPPIYLLTHHSPPDNRLTPAFLQTYLHALLELQHHPSLPPGLLLTTSSTPKYFSNGLDLATFQPGDKLRYLYPLWRKLLTYPMPTCVVLNGHAFAGGLMLAMFHDYRVMNPHRGWLCLNELEFDAELSPAMAGVFKAKVSTATFRSLLLEARRFTSLQALEAGLVDGLGGVEEAVKIMTDVEGGHGRAPAVVGIRGKGSVYGKLKEEVYSEVLAKLEMSVEDEELRGQGVRKQEDRQRREMEEKVLLERLGTLEKAKL